MGQKYNFKNARLWSYAAFCAALAAPYAASAQTVPYECTLSGVASGNLSGCSYDTGGGLLTSTTSLTSNGNCTAGTYCGAKSDTEIAKLPIEAWNVCRWVDNATFPTGSKESIFVPFRSAQEWKQFRDAAPTLLGGKEGLVHCAVPYADNGAPSSMTITPPFASCSSITVNTPNVYGRTGTSLYPNPSVRGSDFSCHNGSTTMQSQIQWKAGDVETVSAGTLSWNTNFLYSPDMTLTADAVNIDYGASVRLDWNIVPYVSTDAITCSVSPAGWGPDSTGHFRWGWSTVTLYDTTTFTLTCVEPPGLTSVASVTVNVNPPPPPCCSTPGDGGGDGGGGGGDGGGD